MAEIAIRSIVKTFTDRTRGREITALDTVSLNIGDHDFVCLLGPSGCGKSTLLNMIAGFEAPSSGRIEVGGTLVEKPGADRGVVFQQPTLMPWLTVADNVAFHLKLKGVGRTERRARAQHFIDLVGLTGFEGHYPSELSGGMNQRVGIARALLMNPRVILMDEPFAALDAQTKLEMQEELVAIWQRIRCTIVFVTHSVDEALVLGNRIAVMTRRPGRIRDYFDFDMPRPRDITSPAFNDAKRRVLALIREEAGSSRKAA
ncbi:MULTISPECIES: ABC transporter ATP-binding protein [Methylobacterium]|jgi:NitT/TauT family transport system ATP-binding protein|uniref:Aliphatic sulfonates import ATP-binding protein SsuB n=1 Tax=Methylobacterium isbiliense TaxID=315478 RepID=A0ABQ4S946_9HYPH|nr:MULTISPECIES: ABC transporter ATP-binding protein [Methylobacterium]MBY0295424.1 ABC transporter ATP-binding protein [Methylobacterium sp.]MDN3627499.1 ABC transporter ATP-binding protein [Methylobacterium isbiliense]GJD98995.1 Aliphatic sulfonates import ATP-binding protein SsuB [Methylobacterium isbiliense]